MIVKKKITFLFVCILWPKNLNRNLKDFMAALDQYSYALFGLHVSIQYRGIMNERMKKR